MSLSEAKRFADKLGSDLELLEAVKPKIKGLASFVEVGKQHGFSFTLDDVKQLVRSRVPAHMLSDAQLDSIAGAGNVASPNPSAIVTVITVSGTTQPTFDVLAVIVAVATGPAVVL